MLGQADGPVAAARVRERLDGDLAYTTVVTILSRLQAKRAVTRERAGLAALRMRRVLDGQDERGAVLARFVTGLTAEDERLLRGLLGEVEGG